MFGTFQRFILWFVYDSIFFIVEWEKWRNINLWAVRWCTNSLHFPVHFCEKFGGMNSFHLCVLCKFLDMENAWSKFDWNWLCFSALYFRIRSLFFPVVSNVIEWHYRRLIHVKDCQTKISELHFRMQRVQDLLYLLQRFVSCFQAQWMVYYLWF